MFLVENNIIKFGGFNIKNPTNEKITSCWGTGCVGLVSKIGYVISLNPILVRAGEEVLSVQFIDKDIEITNTVFLREQFDVETSKSFWLCSKNPIEPQLLSINIETELGTKISICPFTYKYFKK